MKRFVLRLLMSCMLMSCYGVSVARDYLLREEQPVQYKRNWFGSIQIGRSLAFGDDSWHVFKDYGDAKGVAGSLSVGKVITPLFSGRVKARYLELKNRINLEMLDAYGSYIGNNGFYDYKSFALQAEVMFNLTNLLRGHKSEDFFNVYIFAGGGVNSMFDYNDMVDDWDGTTVPGLIYKVDTRTRLMPVGVIGGILDFRVNNDLTFNFEACGSFTGDMMDGVKYEEGYDVYITLSLGATVYF